MSRVRAALLLVLRASPALAKDDRPRLILHTKGSAGPIAAMEFSPDSAELYVAGHDKVVHVWTLREVAGELQGVVARTLRWEFGRGLRGAIYQMTVSPEGEIAVGGHGARDTGGDVAVLDAGNGVIRRSLPNRRETPDGPERTSAGHGVTIASLDYSPSGRQLVSTSRDGEVRLWSPTGAGEVWESVQLRAPVGEHETYQPALFLDDTTVAVVERDGRGSWRIALFDRAAQGVVRRPAPLVGHTGRITALARRPGSTEWASADENGRILVWSDARGPRSRIMKLRGRAPLDLAFSAQGEIVTACAVDDRQQAVVEIWSATANELIDQIEMSRRAGVAAIAVSPDGRLLAIQDPDTDHVSLFRLRSAKGEVVAQPLQRRPTILDSRGRPLTNVAFAADGTRRIAFGTARTGHDVNDYGPLEQAFDFTAMRLLGKLPKRAEWRSPTDDAGPWTIHVGAGRTVVELRNGGRPAGRIDLERVTQGLATCYCLVPDAAQRPVAVAIGTGEQNGVFVYTLPAAGRPPQLLRYFRDHSGDVRALSVSPDGKLLASGGDDQQLKVWSLAGLARTSPTFSKTSAWGADFVSQGGLLTVTDTEPAGIARSRNMRDGDVLAFVRTAASMRRAADARRRAGQPPDNGPDAGKVTTAAEMRAALDELPLFEAAFVQVRRGDEVQEPVVIVPGWEPLLSLFVDVHGEWAAFTPRGDYDSSVAEGNELFGWQVNRGPNVTPRVFTAAELQQEFEKPDLIRRLLGGAAPPAGDSSRLAGVIGQVPDVTILSPRAGEKPAPGQPIEVVAEVVYSDTAAAGDFTVRGQVNGIPLKSAVIEKQGRVHTYRWRSVAPDSLNVFHVLAEKQDDGLLGLIKQDRVTVRGNPEHGRYKLHMLTLAVKDYPETGSFASLKYPIDDARAMAEALTAKKGIYYELGRIHSLYASDVSRLSVDERIETTLRDLENADPGDLLVVYLSGHGYAHGSEYYFVPGHCADSSRDILEQDAIPWHRLRSLADLNCRKVVFIDTCFAGNVLAANEAPYASRSIVKAAAESAKRTGFLVVMSTEEDGIAEEGEEYGNHGAFTHSLLLGLDGAADLNRDTAVSLTELVAFTRRSVAERTLDAQLPVYTPIDVFDAIDPLQLVRTPVAGVENDADEE